MVLFQWLFFLAFPARKITCKQYLLQGLSRLSPAVFHRVPGQFWPRCELSSWNPNDHLHLYYTILYCTVYYTILYFTTLYCYDHLHLSITLQTNASGCWWWLCVKQHWQTQLTDAQWHNKQTHTVHALSLIVSYYAGWSPYMVSKNPRVVECLAHTSQHARSHGPV